MMNGHEQRVGHEGRHYSARDVRGAEIDLRTRAQRLIFISGLVGMVILVLLVIFSTGW
jgi:hypothetical protein